MADTKGSTATGAPLQKSETDEVRFRVCPHTTRLENQESKRRVVVVNVAEREWWL
jgi:hypothetical protein